MRVTARIGLGLVSLLCCVLLAMGHQPAQCLQSYAMTQISPTYHCYWFGKWECGGDNRFTHGTFIVTICDLRK